MQFALMESVWSCRLQRSFVELHPKGAYIAQSAGGTIFRSTKLPNEPQGGTEFWHDAIEQRLAAGFVNVSSTQLGASWSVELQEDSETPYFWTISVQSHDKWLYLVEAYYPNLEQKERYSAAVESIISGGVQ